MLPGFLKFPSYHAQNDFIYIEATPILIEEQENNGLSMRLTNRLHSFVNCAYECTQIVRLEEA